jgi:adenosylcobinamide-GDP ribazoletransferase
MAVLSEWGERLGARIGEISASIHFLTRLPMLRHETGAGTNLAQAAWAFPLAGFVVGLVGALVYTLADRLVLFSWPAAALALAATMLITGALHEDGLADTADGFGGGDTRERKLAIMRDSRIGTYGASALGLSLLLRAGALASFAEPAPALLALVAAHAAARALMPILMWAVPTARRDGLAAEAGRPPIAAVVAAGLLGVLALLLGLGPAHAAAALVLLGVTFAATARLALRQIGGQTGDVLGALEQAGEIVVLLCAAAAR